MSITDTVDTGTLTAMYDDRESADAVAARLEGAGISSSKIKIVAGGDRSSTIAPEEKKGFWASLGDFFMPDEDRGTYAEGLSRGGYVVTVSNLSESESEVALDILDDEGSVDLDEREQSWRDEGWTGYDSSTPVAAEYDRTSSPERLAAVSRSDDGFLGEPARTDKTNETIPVVEESLKVGKRDVNLGRVRVRSYVVETPVSEDVSLHDERVTIDRRPVDRLASSADNLFQDRTIEAEEHAEEAVVSKEARVTEEIGIRKEQADRVETISDSVRSTKVEVDDERKSSLAADAEASRRIDPATGRPI